MSRRQPIGVPPLFAPLIATCLLICPWPDASAQDPPSRVGKWSPIIPLGNVAVHTHVLPTGKVMFWPRHEKDETRNPDPERTIPRHWDPATLKLISPPPSSLPHHNLFCSGHAFLPDGRLFV